VGRGGNRHLSSDPGLLRLFAQSRWRTSAEAPQTEAEGEGEKAEEVSSHGRACTQTAAVGESRRAAAEDDSAANHVLWHQAAESRAAEPAIECWLAQSPQDEKASKQTSTRWIPGAGPDVSKMAQSHRTQ
jgi:hypothetical protein